MFSIQSFFGRDTKFFDLLEASAREVCTCASMTTALARANDIPDALQLVRQARIRCKCLTEEASELAVKTFVTILDREDIEALAIALYKISKPVEKFAERLGISREIFQNARSFVQLEIIEQAAKIVLLMIESFRPGIDTEAVQRLNAQLQEMEEQADLLELKLLEDLYRNTKNPVEVVAIQDLFDLAEKAIDRCRDAGNVILHICHKNT